ncbi:SMODS domain-containing nucleotidyltransferase [Bacteroides sp.]
MGVAENFSSFCSELLVSTTKRTTIASRREAISKRLNKDFWNMDNTTSGALYVGSYGRNTATSYISDIDMVFEMPFSVYNKYNAYQTNGQSAFLQEVKKSIAKTYPNTSLKGDGQIVEVRFSDNMIFEVLPVFKNSDGTYTYADSNYGGSWKKTNPKPEIDAIKYGDVIANNNLRKLCRMARAWKFYCGVPIKGILIDTLAYRFILDWQYKDKSYLYYDYMSRDFFEYLKNQTEGQTTWYALGSYQQITNYDNFRTKAKSAYDKAVAAIADATNGYEWSSKQKWREIYGTRFPN